MQDKALNHPKIRFIWDTEILEVLGDAAVTGLRVRSIKTGEMSDLKCDGFFVAIGHGRHKGIREAASL